MFQRVFAVVGTMESTLGKKYPRVRTWTLGARAAARAAAGTAASAALKRQRRARQRLVQRVAVRLAAAQGADRVTSQMLLDELQRVGPGVRDCGHRRVV